MNYICRYGILTREDGWQPLSFNLPRQPCYTKHAASHLQHNLNLKYTNLFLLVILLALSACGGNDSSSKDEATETPRSVSTQQTTPDVAKQAVTSRETSPKKAIVSRKGESCVEIIKLRKATKRKVRKYDKKYDREVNKQLYKPMTRQEIKRLVKALKPRQLENNKGMVYRYSENFKAAGLSEERVTVLIQDIVSILTEKHLTETLARMQDLPNVDEHRLAWGTEVAKVLNICGEERYQDFGGNPAFQESIQIVLENREILESVVIPYINPRNGGNPTRIP